MSLEEVSDIFGGKVRVRVMGIFEQDHKILMLNHRGMNEWDELWLPPGGGVEYGESIRQALMREFKEEVSLEIEVGEFIGVNEFIDNRFHAYEFFFYVSVSGGSIMLGRDPELDGLDIIHEYAFLSIEEIKEKGDGRFHRLFQKIESLAQLNEKMSFF